MLLSFSLLLLLLFFLQQWALSNEGDVTVFFFFVFFYLEFQDSSAKFYCNIYFAEQFRKMRELIFPEGEERYHILFELILNLFVDS